MQAIVVCQGYAATRPRRSRALDILLPACNMPTARDRTDASATGDSMSQDTLVVLTSLALLVGVGVIGAHFGFMGAVLLVVILMLAGK